MTLIVKIMEYIWWSDWLNIINENNINGTMPSINIPIEYHE